MGDRRAAGKAVLLALCWILSFAAFSLPLLQLERFSLFLQVFVPAALIFGYMSLWRIPRVFMQWQLWIAAVVFAAVVTIGASFDMFGSAVFVTNHPLLALLYFLGRVPAFYMGMVLVLEVMRKGRKQHKAYPAFVYALFALACWLSYLVAVWPGSVSAASVLQLAELTGDAALGTQGPLLQTGLTGLAVWIGQGIFGTVNAAVALYVMIQALVMAWLTGRTVSMIARGGAPAWLVVTSLLFFALCPVFPLYAFAVSADVSFALAALWLVIVVWRIVRSKRAALLDVISLCASALLCTLLHSLGICVAAISLVALLVWALVLHNGLWNGAAYALVCAGCAWLIVQGALIPLLDTLNAPQTAALAAPRQETAGAVLNYGYLMPGFISSQSPAFLWGTGNTVNPGAEAVSAVFARLLRYAPFRILVSPGVYGWIALFTLAVMLVRKRWNALVYLVTPLMVLVCCLLSDLNGAIGYALPQYLAAPALLAAAARAVREGLRPDFF